MSHEIFNQIQKVKVAASKLEGANKVFGTSDYSGLMRHNLNYEVKKLRNIIDDARYQHGQGFQPDGYHFYSALDLMELGY